MKLYYILFITLIISTILVIYMIGSSILYSRDVHGSDQFWTGLGFY